MHAARRVRPLHQHAPGIWVIMGDRTGTPVLATGERRAAGWMEYLAGLFGGADAPGPSDDGASPAATVAPALPVAAPEHTFLGVPLPPGEGTERECVEAAAALPDAAFPRFRMVLPKRTKILVLDLDETLVHSTCRSASDCDFFIEVLIDRSSCLYYLYKRPHVEHFLATVAAWFHLVVYTASLREYADPVVDWLDAGRGLFRRRLFRPACVEVAPGVHAKNLALVDGGDLSRVALVDNTPASFVLHPANGIPVDSWTGERGDAALLDLLPFLDALRFVDDVRSILSLRCP